MADIQLYNTAKRAKVPLEPLVTPGKPKMYVCGPTVYDRAHLGNARPAVVFDVLYRLLRHTYGAENVTYARNFTDVDDKINAEAQRRKAAGAPGTLEELIKERSDETIRWYLEDMGALGVLEPDEMPRATGWIDQMIAMIQSLIDKGHAYAAEGHALFRVRSYQEYGALSGRSVDDMIAGARVEVAPYKEDPMDFVLWKPSPDNLPGWDSPWGRGRPGWHIECSAMSTGLLGDRFDIHGGGNDLIFPHHENEIAQSKCMGHGYARIWMHNEMLQVEGKKMSKSLGNFFTVHDLLDQGIHGETIRLVFLRTHYRKPMDWTETKRNEAEVHLQRWGTLRRHYLSDSVDLSNGSYPIDKKVIGHLSDDLNTSEAVNELIRMVDQVKLSSGVDSEEAIRFFATLDFLGFKDLDPEALRRRGSVERAFGVLERYEQLVEEEREKAKASRDFAAVDQLKNMLIEAGVKVQMAKSGVTLEPGPDFDPSKLEALK